MNILTVDIYSLVYSNLFIILKQNTLGIEHLPVSVHMGIKQTLETFNNKQNIS